MTVRWPKHLLNVDAARTRRATLGLLLVLLLAGCEKSSRPPNILLISIDTLRRDHVSAYGYHRPTTPRLEALAADGVLFTNAVSTSNWTLPAHMSLMTGLPPSLHRAEEDWDKLPTSISTLAEVLKAAGYATGGLASHVYVDGRYGFARGFDTYETHPGQKASEVTQGALDWLQSHRASAFFLFLHYFDPHWSYDPPELKFGAAERKYGKARYLLPFLDRSNQMPEEARDQVVRLYDSEIAYTDDEIGKVLTWLRERQLLDDTIVVVTSDHGEAFYEHGELGHGGGLHGEVTRVPLIMRFPRRKGFSGRRPQLASLMDVPATILSLVGLQIPSQFKTWAVDLSAEQDGHGATREDRFVVLETTRWGPRRFALRGNHLKLVTRGAYQPVVVRRKSGKKIRAHLEKVRLQAALYDLTGDPGESRSLLDEKEQAHLVREMRGRLRQYVDEAVAGMRLTCNGRSVEGAFRGAIQFSKALTDEPLPFPASGATIETVSRKEYRISLAARAEDASILFPVGHDPGEVTIELQGPDGRYDRATFPVPTHGKTRWMSEPDPGLEGCRVWVPEQQLGARKETRQLTDSELERLRALGYIQ